MLEVDSDRKTDLPSIQTYFWLVGGVSGRAKADENSSVELFSLNAVNPPKIS
jgi:hypothetical protein